MTPPAGMTDLFPAFSLGGVALIGLMERIEPPRIVRWGVLAVMALLLILYLAGALHVWLPDTIGLPLYGLLILVSSVIIAWNWRTKRAARRR